MAREIKFRGKRSDNGEWVNFNFDGAYVGENGIEISPKRFIRDCGFKVDPSTIGQFTGLHDKSGKEIYEGDILKRESPITGHTYLYKVVWDADKARFMSDSNTIQELLSGALERGCVYAGNIYEHPHLLES